MVIPFFPNMIWAFIGIVILALNFIYWKNIQKTQAVIMISAILTIFIGLKILLSLTEEFVVKLTDMGYTPFPRSGIILIGAIWSLLYSLNEYKKLKN